VTYSNTVIEINRRAADGPENECGDFERTKNCALRYGGVAMGRQQITVSLISLNSKDCDSVLEVEIARPLGPVFWPLPSEGRHPARTSVRDFAR